MSTTPSQHETGMNGAVVRQIRAERAARGLTVDALALASGIPKRTLIRYLNAERPLTLRAVEQLALGLGMEYNTLVERARTERHEQ